MMSHFEDMGRQDILKDIQRGGVSILSVWEHYRQFKTENIPTTNSIKAIDPMIYDWIEDYDITPRTKKVYRNNVKQLMKFGHTQSSIEELPLLLEKYRTHCQKKGFFRPFNHTRSTVQSFVHNKIGRYSDLWFKVSEIKPFPGSPKRKGNPQSVKTIRWMMKQLPKKYGDMIWSLCTTGMGWTDYKGEWSVKTNHIYIEGTKNKNRIRKIPRVSSPTRPTTTEQYLRKAIRSIPKKNVQIYDFRRTYSHWLEMSRIPRSRRKAYMGHSTTDILGLYESHEVDGFLKSDGKRLKEYIELETTK
jgi:hypothetical protein